MKITLRGFEDAIAAVRATPKQIDRASSRAVRKTARDIRRAEIVEQLMQDTGVKRAELNRRLKLKYHEAQGKVGSSDRTHSATITPSAAGIKANMFRNYRMEIVDEKNHRARGYVPWVNGTEKLVAGFINPHSNKQRLLRSRNHTGRLPNLRTAIAPSVASMVKDLSTDQWREEGRDMLQDNLIQELDKEMKK